jgi:hypothetical protein
LRGTMGNTLVKEGVPPKLFKMEWLYQILSGWMDGDRMPCLPNMLSSQFPKGIKYLNFCRRNINCSLLDKLNSSCVHSKWSYLNNKCKLLFSYEPVNIL